MPRLSLTRHGRSIGFLDVRGARISDAPAVIPGLEGEQRGVGIVLQLGSAPVAALIFPFDGESVDLGSPFEWLPDVSPDELLQVSWQQRALGATSFLDIRGALRLLEETNAERVWNVEFEAQNEGAAAGYIHLEANDPDIQAFGDWEFLGVTTFGSGHLFTSGASEGQGEVRIDAITSSGFHRGGLFIRFAVKGAVGGVELKLRLDPWQNPTRGGFRFRLSASKSAEQLLRFINRIEPSERSLPFQIWVGELKYDPISSERPLLLKHRGNYAALDSALRDLPLKTIRLLGARLGVPFESKTETDAAIVPALMRLAESRPEGIEQIAVEAHKAAPLRGILQRVIGGISKRDPYLTDFLRQTTLPKNAEGDSLRGAMMPIVVGVSHPDWQPKGVPNFQILAQLGQVIAAICDVKSIEYLEKDESVLSIDCSRPGANLECIRSATFIRARSVHNGHPAEHGDQSIVAIVDCGIDLLHECFRDDQGRTRILAIWDQQDTTGPAPTGYGYGTLHTGAKIDEYIRSGTSKPRLGTDPEHGTHVASIAAGRRCGRFAGGVAPGAKILVVVADDAKFQPGSKPSLGYSVSHLAALQYIKEVAQREKLPVVVNVSLGMNAGSHDGTSLLEHACDNFCGDGQAPGFVVVKSAGNDRKRNGHATITINDIAQETLRWHHPAGAAFRDDIELWFRPFVELEFTLVSPTGDSTLPVRADQQPIIGSFSSGNSYRISYERFHKDNGHSLVAVTVEASAAMTIAPGHFQLIVKSLKRRGKVLIDCWIERNGEFPAQFSNHLDENKTLSIPGTAESVLAVGAVESRIPLTVGDFSAYGTTRDDREKPEVVAPGVKIKAARSGSTNGIVEMSGTSMAAPHVTGAVALLLSHCFKKGSVPNAGQVRSALTASTRGANGQWDRGTGYGLIDIAALLRNYP